jgi:spore germination protein PD
MKKVVINLYVQNGDINVNYIKVNAVSNSSVLLLGDAETVKAQSISTSKGVPGPLIAPIVTSSA